MGFMQFHCIMVVMEGNMTMPAFLLPKWNGICAIPPYIDTNGMQLWQCHLLDYCLGGIEIVAFHHKLTQVEGNCGNAPFLNT